jgi:hypothetical protein
MVRAPSARVAARARGGVVPSLARRALSVVSRSHACAPLPPVTNVLPTRELKIDLLRTTNALGIMGVSLLLTLWSFLLAGITGTLVASPSVGVLGSAFFFVALVSCMGFIAPIRYLGVMLLHEETKRFMGSTPSFLHKKTRTTSAPARQGLGAGATLAQTVMQAAEAAAADS